MRLSKLLTLFFLSATAATLQAEHIDTPDKVDPIMASPMLTEPAGVRGVSMSHGEKKGGGHQCHKKHGGGGSHGAQKHGGSQGGMKHGGGGAGMKQQMAQHREDMENRIRRIEERLAVMQTMLEQLLQR